MDNCLKSYFMGNCGQFLDYVIINYYQAYKRPGVVLRCGTSIWKIFKSKELSMQVKQTILRQWKQKKTHLRNWYNIRSGEIYSLVHPEKAKKCNILEWPSQSSDLNPIEHAFHLLKTKLRPTNKQQLKTTAVKAWQSIKKEETKCLVMSMTSRLQAVIASKGFSTKY